MTSRDLVIKSLRHEPVERAPRDLWTLPGIRMFRSDELDRMLVEYPIDFTVPNVRYGDSLRREGTPDRIGKYTDEWGCVWHVAEDGVVGEVKEFPIPYWPALRKFKPPYEILDNADFSMVNKGCAETSKFVLANSQARPFERLQFLRGSERTFIDLMYSSIELFLLLDMMHDYYTREIRMLVETDVDGISFMDDWGAQDSLLISPDMWRDIFKPFYKDYCEIIHGAGKFAFMHSDGFIEPIIPDLFEIGVDALNSQLFCMDIEDIGEKYAGKVTFWGEIDRQLVLPFGTKEDVRNAVRRVRKALDKGQGGVIAQAEWGLGVNYENIATVFDEWLKPL